MLAVMQVCGGSQNFNVGNTLRLLVNCIPAADRLSSHFFVCAFFTLTNPVHPLFAQSL
jgi:hypothetical protein